MKQNKRIFNSLLRTYNKSRRKLTNLQTEDRNYRKQSILQKRIEKLHEQLTYLMMSIKKTAVVGAMATAALAFSATDANAQTFASYTINPFSLGYTGGGQSAPSFFDLDNDGDLDVIKDDGTSGDFYYYENTGTATNPVFGAAQINPFGLYNTGGWVAIQFVDIDNDGDADAMVQSDGDWEYFQNTGTASSPAFAPNTTNPFNLTYLADYSSFDFEDLDNDGDLDLMAGDPYGDFTYYQNTGNPAAPTFAAGLLNPFGLLNTGDGYATPCFVDLDRDGDFDLMVGSEDTDFYYFENTGTNTAPAYAAAIQNPFSLTNLYSNTNYSSPTFVDIDNDGDLDMFSNNNYYGDFFYFENTSCNTVDQTVTAAITNGCDSLTTTIDLANSETGVNYYLRNNLNNTIITGPIAGTGSGLSINTGSITNTTTYNVYGTITDTKPVGALKFNGNTGTKKVSLDTLIWNNNFAGTTQLTVEAWVKRSATGNLQTVIGNYSSGYPFLFRITNNNIHLYINSGPSTTGAINIPTGSWTHLAGTYDGTDIRVYVNGVLDGTPVGYGLPLASSFNEMKIGGGLANNTEYFEGDIADVRLWNVARTQPQIAADMNNVLMGNEAGLVANYQFTEDKGSSTANAANGNLYPGTFVNSPYWITGPILNGVTCHLEMTDTATVTIGQSSTGTITTTACKSYTAPSGAIYTTSNTYLDTIQNAAMCDSVITINLTINTVDVSITSASPMFTANATSATYQWVDCNNSFAAISGETNASFTATANGDYAVIVTQNGCTDTSACVNVTGVGINETTLNSMSVYPNPTTGITTINLGNNNIAVNYIITGVDGRIIDQQQNITTNQINIDLTNQSNGVYFIKLFNQNSNTNIKLIKN